MMFSLKANGWKPGAALFLAAVVAGCTPGSVAEVKQAALVDRMMFAESPEVVFARAFKSARDCYDHGPPTLASDMFMLPSGQVTGNYLPFLGEGEITVRARRMMIAAIEVRKAGAGTEATAYVWERAPSVQAVARGWLNGQTACSAD